jgi:hypothetical protein
VQRGLLPISVGENLMETRTLNEPPPDVTQVFRPTAAGKPMQD